MPSNKKKDDRIKFVNPFGKRTFVPHPADGPKKPKPKPINPYAQ